MNKRSKKIKFHKKKKKKKKKKTKKKKKKKKKKNSHTIESDKHFFKMFEL